jgi:hypothetical protein
MHPARLLPREAVNGKARSTKRFVERKSFTMDQDFRAMSLAMRIILLLSVPLLLGGCLARTAVDIVTLPVKAAGAGLDAVTTSQAEADQRRGRELREEEERLGREARRREREERRARERSAEQQEEEPQR